MKKKLLIFLIVLIPIAALAIYLSVQYASPIVFSGAVGGKTTSANYSGIGSAAGSPVGKTTSASYTGIAGGVAAMGMASAAGDPSITSVEVDGNGIADDDFIKASGTLTAIVTDEGAIDTALSSVEVDGTAITFTALTGSSSYSASTGLLTYVYSGLTDGDHTIGITAVDGGGASTVVRYSVKVDTGSFKAAGVFLYPNPFNPNSGIGKIAYNLNIDANTSVYIFNSIGQLIYKQPFLAGAEGARTGYNEVDWDGKTSGGETVGNDVYFLRVVSAGKVIGRCKIAVIK